MIDDRKLSILMIISDDRFASMNSVHNHPICVWRTIPGPAAQRGRRPSLTHRQGRGDFCCPRSMGFVTSEDEHQVSNMFKPYIT